MLRAMDVEQARCQQSAAIMCRQPVEGIVIEVSPNILDDGNPWSCVMLTATILSVAAN